MESFNGRVRDELLNIEEFGSLTEAQFLTEEWRIEYNTYRPTRPSLVHLYAAQWTTQHQPTLS